MNTIKQKFKDNKKLYIEYEKYYEKFSNSVGSYYREELKKLNDYIEEFLEIIEELKKIINFSEESNEIIFKIIHYFNSLDNNTAKIKEKFLYFNPGKHRLNLNLSSTYLLETSSMFDKILILINNTMKNHQIYDVEIINFLGNKIFNKINFETPKEEFENLRLLYAKYKNSVSLYAYISQKIIDQLFKMSKEKRIIAFYILNLIENDKDEELNKIQPDKKLTNKNNNPPLKSFGMVPKTEFIELNSLIKRVFNKIVSGKIKTAVLDKIGESNNITIIINNKITPREAEYKIKSLLENSNYKNYSGINSELIRKFETIKLNKGYSSYKFKFQIYGKPLESENKILLLESTSNKKYRVMSPYSSYSYFIDKKTVPDFVKFVKNGKIKSTTRVENYNKLMENKMIKNMFLNKKVEIKDISDESQVNEIKFLRSKLYLSILDFYMKIVEKKYKFGKNIKGRKDIIKIINMEEIKDIFQEILIKNYYNFLNKNDILGKNDSFVFNEVISTFMVDLQIITRGFIREIYLNSESIKISNNISEKSSSVIYGEVRDIFEEVIKKSLNKIMDDKSNIYQSLIFKSIILNI